VPFQSSEDRMVNRSAAARAGAPGRANRYAPEQQVEAPAFELIGRKSITADADELASNPRARSARLRVARRTAAPAGDVAPRAIGMPQLKEVR